MKKAFLKFELWFNKNLGWIFTNVRKVHLLEARISKQEKELEKLEE